jgi:hypothetical protein
MLTGDVAHLWRRLRPVTQQALDGHLSTSPILPRTKTKNNNIAIYNSLVIF